MGTNRIQGQIDERRFIHEYSAVWHGRIHQPQEHGEAGSGPHQVPRIAPMMRISQGLTINRCNNVLWISAAKDVEMNGDANDVKMEG
jgi:hypothetical protein